MPTLFKEQTLTSNFNPLSGLGSSLFQKKFTACANSAHNRCLRVVTVLILLTVLGITGCSCEDPEVKFTALMDSAAEFVKEERYSDARIQLLSAIDIKPKNANAYFELAEVFIRLQKIPQAVEQYNTAINYDPKHRKARLHLASILLAAREFEQAESNVTKLLEMDSQDHEALVLKANIESLGPRKNYAGAREILEGLLAKKPDDVVSLASLGTVEIADENTKKAEELFRRALKVDPNNSPLQMALADLYSRQGRLDEAQEMLETLLEQNPEQSGLNYIFGEFLLRRGLGKEALAQYEETVEKDPARHQARDRLYDMYLTRNEIDKARALADSLEKALPNDPGINYFKGRNYLLDSKNKEALAAFSEAIKLLPNFAPAFRRVGQLELQFGKGNEAIEHLNQAIAIDSTDVGARLSLARILFRRSEFTSAAEHLDQILARYPRQLGANILRADIALIEGETEKARKVYDLLIKSFPNSPSGFFKLGLLEEKIGNTKEALALYEKTLDFDRGILPPARRYISLRSKSGADIGVITTDLRSRREASKESKAEYDLLIGSLILANNSNPDRFNEAKKIFLGALEAKPSLVGAYFALGAIDSISGDLDAAAENYKKLLSKRPSHIPTQMLLALTRERQEKYEEAAEVYRAILKTQPRFGPAANNLAWLLADSIEGADLNEALKFAEVAKEQLSKESSVADTLGWVHYKRGNYRIAKPLLEEAVELAKDQSGGKPINPEILYHLGATLAQLEDKTRAKEVLSAAEAGMDEKNPLRAEIKKIKDTL
jgi:tetratricopeptide (TPR) repeat protein